MKKVATIVIICSLCCGCSILTEAKPIKFNCSNLLNVEQIESPKYLTNLLVILNVPKNLIDSSIVPDAWRLELETDVPFHSISGPNLWIKHFQPEGRAIIKNDVNSGLKNEILKSGDVRLNILWAAAEADELSGAPRVIRFSWNDGQLCKFLLNGLMPDQNSTESTLSRRRRNPIGSGNTQQRRQTSAGQDRRWNLNNGKSYFLTTIEE